MATFLVVHGPSEGLKFALGQNNLVMIGRNHDATFQILGGRFVFIRKGEQETEAKDLNVILNWLSELNAKVPVR